jgi:hypothetical protein
MINLLESEPTSQAINGHERISAKFHLVSQE